MLKPRSQVSMSSLQPLADLLEVIRSVGKSPAVSTKDSESQYGTTTTSNNWKLFVIGLLSPDNDVSFYPVGRRAQQLALAPMPPKLPKPPAPRKAGKKGTTGGPVQNKQYSSFSRDAFRQTVINEYARLTGSAPSEELLSLLCAHAWCEMGATIGYYKRDGVYSRVPVIATLNNNIGGVHKGPGAVKSEVLIPGTGNNVFWTDSQGQTHEFKPDGTPVNPDDKTWARPNKGKMIIADLTLPGNKGFYDSVGSGTDCYVDIDTQAGSPYLVAFRSHGTMEGGVASWLSLLINKYPGIKQASNSEEYATALLNGEPPARNGRRPQYFDSTIGPSSLGGNGHYVRSLEKQQESYRNEYPSNTGVTGNAASPETIDPNQKIWAIGQSTDPEDPLGQVYGRNIQANADRFRSIIGELWTLAASINLMRSLPPLVMLVNPQEFRRSYENTVDFGVKTRTGNIVHTWLEQPVKINASGVSAAQFAVDASMVGGLTNYNRIHSLSYRNLMSLVLMYKNNGAVYSSWTGQDGFGGSLGNITLLGSVFIIYDDHLYIGSFDSLSITDSADKPHNLSYSFTFTVRYDMHIDVGLDAQAAKAGMVAGNM